MKALLTTSFLCIFAVFCQAQINIQSNVELEKEGLTLAKISAMYKPATNTQTSFERVNMLNNNNLQKHLQELSYQLFAADTSRAALILHFCVNKDKQVERIIYQISYPKTKRPDSSHIAKAINGIRASLQGFVWDNAAPNYLTIHFKLGHKTVKKGANSIFFLADALATQAPDTVKILDLSSLNIKELPEIVYRFQNLEELDISENHIKHLQIDLGRFPKLKKFAAATNATVSFDFGNGISNIENLNMLGNKLTEFSLDFQHFPKLKIITLYQNELTENSIKLSLNKTVEQIILQKNKLKNVPPSIRNCKKLKSLWLGGNTLTNLNEESFVGLRKLQDLNLYQCGITKLPESIGKMRSLEIFDVYHNHLTELPKSIKRLRKIQQLAIANNQLTTLPEKLGRKRHLVKLYTHHNRLSKLPESLRKSKNLELLDINHNWISAYPTVINKLKKLSELDLSFNNFSEFPVGLENLVSLKTVYINGNPVTNDNALAQKSEASLKKLESKNVEVK